MTRLLLSKYMTKMTRLFPLATFLIVSCSSGLLSGSNARLSSKPKVLVVGDSLTVGGFGESMEAFFVKQYGSHKVTVFGCCGASVEHFLKDTSVFTCTCGYRQTADGRKILDDWKNGRRPGSHPTPKLADLRKRYKPEVLIVQLGTNNFDSLTQASEETKKLQAEYFNRLAAAMAPGGSVKRSIWITPPDSTKYHEKIENMVDEMIRSAADKHGVNVIKSKDFTEYKDGKSGTDGIHYHTKPAAEWFAGVKKRLVDILSIKVATQKSEPKANTGPPIIINGPRPR